MEVSVKDKRIKSVMRGDVRVKGFQPEEVERVAIRLTVLIAAPTLKVVADNHPEWRVHRWKGSKVRWSIDVLANTRLLFNYDLSAHRISSMIYEDPH